MIETENDERGMSPVIAVILMILIAAIIAGIMFGLEKNQYYKIETKEQPNKDFLLVKIIDYTNNSPLSNVTITVREHGEGRLLNGPYISNESGYSIIQIPKGYNEYFDIVGEYKNVTITETIDKRPPVVKYNLTDSFQFFGALIAIFLGILKLLDYNKKRVLLKIDLTQNLFISRPHLNIDDVDVTKIEINVDLRNTGLEPTSLVGVVFFSDNELLTNLQMTTRIDRLPFGLFQTFDEIRINPNDRKLFNLHLFKNFFLPNDITELNAKLIFKTTQKDISKKIKLTRQESLN